MELEVTDVADGMRMEVEETKGIWKTRWVEETKGIWRTRWVVLIA